MNFITTLTLGYLLWHWPLNRILNPDGTFNGIEILLLLGLAIIWLRAAIYLLFIDKMPWDK